MFFKIGPAPIRVTGHRLPVGVEQVLAAWKKARGSDLLPPVSFAASQIPPHCCRCVCATGACRTAPYLYGLVGDDPAAVQLEDPRGSTVLHSAPEDETSIRRFVWRPGASTPPHVKCGSSPSEFRQSRSNGSHLRPPRHASAEQ
jgi:hypothetical protein